jgi:hypothetical protein
MKIAVCVPHYGPLNARFVASLADLISYTAALPVTYNGAVVRPQIGVLFAEDGPLEYKRTHLAKQAIDAGADYLQWIDTDHTFPRDATIRLAKHDRPIVGCNYLRRDGLRPTALDLAGNDLSTTEATAKAALVQPVSAIGLGFCLMKAGVFSRVQHPWFKSEVSAAGELVLGEDVHFCNQARQAGLMVHVDHGLSWEIGHLTEVIKFNSDAGETDACAVLPAAGP